MMNFVRLLQNVLHGLDCHVLSHGLADLDLVHSGSVHAATEVQPVVDELATGGEVEGAAERRTPESSLLDLRIFSKILTQSQ